MRAKDEVREASNQFYAALNLMLHGDASSMADIWSHSASVTTMHPMGGREVGWEAVMGSFGKVAQLASGGNVGLKDQFIIIAGDTACEVGIEHGEVKLAGQQIPIEHRVTNIYQREAGAWRIMHHHTDISPAILDVLNRL